jgi:uncharacterized cupredoxin-like copper-binding protein
MKRLHLILLLLVAVVACDSEPAGTLVGVQITDGAFELSTSSEVAGLITFAIDNTGSQVHEFEVFSGAEPGQVLPLASGVADTSGLTVLDEVEDLLPGSSSRLAVDLEPGTYLLICNLPAHYAAGNWAEFTITG